MKKNDLIKLNLQYFATENNPDSAETKETPDTKAKDTKESTAPDGGTKENEDDLPDVDLGKPLAGTEPDTPPQPSLEDLMTQIAELKAANASLHKTVNKVSSDAADWKKKYQSKLTVDEQKVQAEKEKDEYYQSILNQFNVLKGTISYQAKGYTEEEARKIAEAQCSGDFETAADVMNQHNEIYRKACDEKVKKALAKAQEPASGGSKVDYAQMYAKAMNAGDKQAAITALLNQAGMTVT